MTSSTYQTEAVGQSSNESLFMFPQAVNCAQGRVRDVDFFCGSTWRGMFELKGQFGAVVS